MKISIKRRLLSLLLALAMALTLAPTAWLSGPATGGNQTPFTANPDTPKDPTASEDPGAPEDPGTPEAPAVESIELGGDNIGMLTPVTANQEYYLTLEPGGVSSGTARLTVDLKPNTAENQNRRVVWKTSDSSVVSVTESSDSSHPGLGHVGIISSRSAAGKADVTVSVDEKVFCTIHVEVSGIKLSDAMQKGVTIKENETKQFVKGTDYELFGRLNPDLPQNKDINLDAKLTVAAQTGMRSVNIPQPAGINSFSVEGRTAGKARLQVQVEAGGQRYSAEFTVEVEALEVTISYKDGCSPVNPLKFSNLEQLIDQQCRSLTGSALQSIIDLRVPTNEGILYLGYKSPEDTGAGVGSSVTYYASTGARGPYIKDITFLPNASFKGETAIITFTGQTTGSDGQPRTFKGKIEVTLTEEKSDLTLKTRREIPVKLEADQFSRACQEAVGSQLDYVVFTLPPANQGTLYVDYKSETDYASKVSANVQYKRSQLDNITFVPAAGYVGEVRVSYAGYSVSGNKYAGELIIQVQQGLDDAITYNDNGSGYVTFSGGDFDAFCENATGQGLGSVSFTPPLASQGTLYSSTSAQRGTEVATGQAFGYTGLNRVTFQAAAGFDGVVRIPFTGQNRSGAAFQGTVEVHIQSAGTSQGDISYICAAGQSVKLELSDFSQLCQRMTGQRLHYISFQSLPDFTQGSLYHNRTSSGGMGTRVGTSTKYFHSATPYISNLSFWASQNFRDSVDIPFTGSAVSGQTFTGILTISSGAGAGSGSSRTITYQGLGQEPVRFTGKDFDEVCRQATNEALQYVRFTLPAPSQGFLYYDYISEVNPTALASDRDLYLNGDPRIDRVSFVPSRTFSGAVMISYLGASINGRTFTGVVEINILPASAMGGLVRYETTGAPVHIDAYRIQEASGGSPSSLRFTGLPSADQGKLYYEYAAPTQYSGQGNTSTQYGLYSDPLVSKLTFVPKAGFYGEVNIPYIGMNQGVSSYNGAIRIMVSQPSASANFTDLTGYSAQTKSAVDFLYAQGVVNGVGDGKYDPGASIRRGDFCLMLARAFRFNVGSSARGFTDVPGDAYYAQAVNQLYALGVVNGVGGGKFSPSASVSRQDAVLMVQRTLQQAGISAPDGSAEALASYSDQAEVSGYAKGAVAGLAQLGLLPAAGGKLAPKADLTRADMALLLHRAMTQ